MMGDMGEELEASAGWLGKWKSWYSVRQKIVVPPKWYYYKKS